MRRRRLSSSESRWVKQRTRLRMRASSATAVAAAATVDARGTAVGARSIHRHQRRGEHLLLLLAFFPLLCLLLLLSLRSNFPARGPLFPRFRPQNLRGARPRRVCFLRLRSIWRPEKKQVRLGGGEQGHATYARGIPERARGWRGRWETGVMHLLLRLWSHRRRRHRLLVCSVEPLLIHSRALPWNRRVRRMGCAPW